MTAVGRLLDPVDALGVFVEEFGLLLRAGALDDLVGGFDPAGEGAGEGDDGLVGAPESKQIGPAKAAAEAEAISGRKNIPVVVLPDGMILVEPSDPELLAALGHDS